jgi:hypothetical protein
MKISNKTYQPILTITVKAVEDIPIHSFVNFAGEVTGLGEAALGVVDQNWKQGEFMSVIVLGTGVVVASEIISAGDSLSSTATGTAKKVESTNAIIAIALEDADADGFLRCLIVH